MTKKARIAQMQLLRLRLLRDIEQCAKAITALENAESKARAKEKERRIFAKEAKNEKTCNILKS